MHQGQQTVNRPLTLHPTFRFHSKQSGGHLCGLTSRAPAARAGPRPSALGSTSTRSGDAARARCLSLLYSKIQPQSSGLRGRAALPASRTARRPAPAPTHPWRPRPHAGGSRQALTPAHAAQRHCGEHWGSRGRSGKVYFRGRRRRTRSPNYLKPVRRTASSKQPGLGALAAAPTRVLAPPTSRIAQAQSALPPERAGAQEDRRWVGPEQGPVGLDKRKQVPGRS